MPRRNVQFAMWKAFHDLRTVVRIDILSAVPRLLDSWFNESILERAKKKGLAEVHVHDLRDWSTDKHRRLDDYPFGGGAGMVMTIEPIHRAITELKAQRDYGEVIYLCPDGQLLDQPLANELSLKGNLILLCGHYKGVDERVREHLITREVSIGDFVLSGGELAAAVLSDAVIRLLPGVLGDESSALSDSFQDGLVAPPDYTRPADYQGWKVPDVLLSGHQANIDTWRHQQAVARTRERRPGLLDAFGDQDR
ncbi:MAG TPA: tRNA (guanosine(37)-N1)-methyltransferase TrmD [Flavobacteriales bacterium]|nr:tRNA (guanosine(37)-N1)-methyltransferase TrmD [Flavobacteriales bacterium]